MRKSWLAGAALAALTFASSAQAETKVAIGFSGWTGFGPLTLAKEAGIFKRTASTSRSIKFRRQAATGARIGRYPVRGNHR